MDLVALYSLKRIQKFNNLIPLRSTGDGSCLYNSVSILLCGNESLSLILRFETLKYMVNNFEKLNSIIYKVDKATICSPDESRAIKDAASVSGWGIHFFHSLLLKSLHLSFNGVLPFRNNITI